MDVSYCNKLHEAQLYLSPDKVNLYSQRMDCLGHIISDKGIHADADKNQDWVVGRYPLRALVKNWT